jgi:hypothetical protein
MIVCRRCGVWLRCLCTLCVAQQAVTHDTLFIRNRNTLLIRNRHILLLHFLYLWLLPYRCILYTLYFCFCHTNSHIAISVPCFVLAASGSAVFCNAALTTLRRWCENLLAARASPPAARGGNPGLRPAPLSNPRHAGTSTATCAWDLPSVLADVSFIQPLSPFVPSFCPQLPRPCRCFPRH